MVQPYMNNQRIEAKGGYFKTSPTDLGMIASPCRRRPDTGEPCVKLKADKNCPECENCYLMGRGDCKDPTSYNHNSIPQYAPRKTVYQECRWTGCTETTKGNHCGYHAPHYSNRMRRWKQLHGDKKPDLKVIYRPIEPIGGRKPRK